jgi:CheY-like chemotaxis protein
VLVVDDSETIRQLIAMNLELEGYEVSTAADAETCMALLAEVMAEARPMPDVLMLDVIMPGLDGIELTRRLRSEPKTASLPVVIVSASAQPRDFDRARAAGADGYITKPFDPDELVSEIERLLQLRRP